MQYGIFDHLDLGDTSVSTHYRNRLDFIEACEQAGIASYHIAEHHLTTLGMAPSPNLFLSAVAQRTQRLRFGPMIFAAPLYHPLRLLEEIAMLDQMSEGRLEMGFGRGAVAAEIEFFGVDPKTADEKYQNLMNYVTDGLTHGKVTVGRQDGSQEELPLTIPTFQTPHPPLWYGQHTPPSARKAALRGMNTLNLNTAAETRACTDVYKATWKEQHGDAPLPRMGIGRFVVVNKDASLARAAAQRAYKCWYDSFTYLSSRLGFSHFHHRPESFDGMVEEGRAIAGTPDMVAEYIVDQTLQAGTNYFVGQLAFGNLTRDEMLTSIGLFGQEVMPKVEQQLSRAGQTRAVAA